jgi:hypothetical protein
VGPPCQHRLCDARPAARCRTPIPNPYTCTPLTYCVAVDAPVAHAQQRCEPRGVLRASLLSQTALLRTQETLAQRKYRPAPPASSAWSGSGKWQFAKQAQISAAQRHSTHTPLRVLACSPAFCAKSTLVCTFMSDDFAFNITGFLILHSFIHA